jgi:CheY-like chemotaxis protein
MAEPGSRVVLVVDDDSDSRDALSTQLFFLGYSTLLAPDHDRALSILRDSPPDAMILNSQMPGMRLAEFLDKVRALKEQPSVVLLTPHKIVSEEHLGMKHVLPRPVDLDSLNRKLRDCLVNN